MSRHSVVRMKLLSCVNFRVMNFSSSLFSPRISVILLICKWSIRNEEKWIERPLKDEEKKRLSMSIARDHRIEKWMFPERMFIRCFCESYNNFAIYWIFFMEWRIFLKNVFYFFSCIVSWQQKKLRRFLWLTSTIMTSNTSNWAVLRI